MRHQNMRKSRQLNAIIGGVVMLVTCAFSLSSVTAQTLYVNKSVGAQTTSALNDLRKITFSSGNVTVHKTDNTSGIYALGELDYLSFKDFTVGLENQLPVGVGNLITYPNPVNDVLYINLLGMENMDGSIRIISLEGRVMLQQKINNESFVRLTVTQLPPGSYVCRYTNATEVKTVKIIKQ